MFSFNFLFKRAIFYYYRLCCAACTLPAFGLTLLHICASSYFFFLLAFVVLWVHLRLNQFSAIYKAHKANDFERVQHEHIIRRKKEHYGDRVEFVYFDV